MPDTIPALSTPSQPASPSAPHAVTALLAVTATTNLALWLIWPSIIVAFARGGHGPLAAGLFGAVAWVAMLVALMAAPAFVRHLNRRHTITVACGLVSGGAAVALMVEGVTAQVVATVGVGLGTGLRWVAVDGWLADSVQPHRRGRALALGEVIAGLTFAAGPAIAAILPEAGIFALAALLPLIAPVLLAWLLPHPPEGAGATDLAEDDPVRLRGALLVVVAAAIFGGLHESGFAAIASLFALEGGSSDSGALVTSAAVGVGSFVAQYAIGAAADHRGGLPVLRFCALMVAAAVAVLAVVPTSLLVVSLVVGAFGGGLYTTAIIYGLQSPLIRLDSSRLIGVGAFAYVVGTLVAPPLSGAALASLGPRLGALGLGLAGLWLFVWLLTRKNQGIPHDVEAPLPASSIT